MFITILAFLIVLGVLVLVHEFGHFIVAKKSGVKVEEFAFGFPPRLLSFKKGETRYSINAIPFGGYVKMLGELEHSSHPRAFENQSPGKRFAISIAGVAMNVLLAWIILTVGFAIGMPPLVSDPDALPGRKLNAEITVAGIESASPAESAGLKTGDILIGAQVGTDKVAFTKTSSVSDFTKEHKGQKIDLQYKRQDKVENKEIVLASGDQAPLGVGLVDRSSVRVAWYRAPYVALYETAQVIKTTASMLGSLFGDLFSHGKVAEGVGGPIVIYVYSGLALRAGFVIFIQFIAMLSINLALINILPFPALDGGRLLFIAMEKIRGKKVVREDIENIIHTIGFVILIALLIAISYRDLAKYF